MEGRGWSSALAMSVTVSSPEAVAKSTELSISDTGALSRRLARRVARSMAVMVMYELRFTSYELGLFDGDAVSLAEFEGEAGEFNDALCDESAGVFGVSFVFTGGKE